jgi:HD-GYP domain-containing protein (c-di-GMP phosphodiesterase class II)
VRKIRRSLRRSTNEPLPQDYDNRAEWKARPFVARLVRIALFAIPILAAIAVTMLLGHAFYRSRWPLGLRLGWMAAMFVVASLISRSAARLGERFLPLNALCQLNLRFPEIAPSRVSTALRIGNTAHRERVLEDFQREGLSSDPQTSALQVLELIQILNAHDRKTRGHSEKVRALSEVIATEMGLSDEEHNRLRWSSMLHDIGKLNVPAVLLNKNGKPTTEEWDLIKTHPGAGRPQVEVLSAWLGDSINCVWEHHERFDGTGYPQRLSGNQISLSARIVAVADSFETMTSTRSYKQPMSYNDSRAELVKCSGTHFDPTVVRAFLQVGRRESAAATGLIASIVGHFASDGGRFGNMVRTISQAMSNGAGAAVVAPVAKIAQMAAAPGAEFGSSLGAAFASAPTKAVAKAAVAKVVTAVTTTTMLIAPTTTTASTTTTTPTTTTPEAPTTTTTTTTAAPTTTTTTEAPTTTAASPTTAPDALSLEIPDTEAPTTVTRTTTTTSTTSIPKVVVVAVTTSTTTTTTEDPTTTTTTTTTEPPTTTTSLPVVGILPGPSVTIPPSTTTTTTLNPVTSCGTSGWFMEVFDNPSFGGSAISTSCVTSPNRDWGNGAAFAKGPVDGFSVRFTADVDFGLGSDTLSISGDDSIRVLIDGLLVADASAPVVVPVSPGPGSHRVIVEMVETTGSAKITFGLASGIRLTKPR